MSGRRSQQQTGQPPVDRELMTGFLVEAWDILAGLETGISGLTSPAAVQAADMLLLFSHRLRGSAALYGLPEVSSLGEAIEEMVRRGGALPWAVDDPRIGFLNGALEALREALDSLGSSGDEPRGLLEGLRFQHASALPAGSREAPGRGEAIAAELNDFAQRHPEVLEYFGPEAEENLEAAATALDSLRQTRGAEGDPSSDAPSDALQNRETLTVLFRAVHTLKGAAYTVGANPIGDLSHRLEDLLVALREDRLTLRPEVLRVLERGAEAMRWMIRAAHGDSSPQLTRELEQALTRVDEGLGELAREEPAAVEPSITEPRAAAAPTPDAPIAPAAAPPRATIRVQLDRLDQLMNLMGELVISRGRVERRVERLGEVEELLAGSRQRMERAVGEFNEKYLDPHLREAQERETPTAITETNGGASGLQLPKGGWAEAFGELEFDRYDDFNILARRISELSSDLGEVGKELGRELSTLRGDVTRIQQLTRDLRTSISRARMVPVGQLFARFTRVARSAAEEAGKLVSLELSGEGVEVDNLIIEQIADPLLHLVQNAVIHGIESEEERQAADKSRQGQVELRAKTQGRSIVIEVADDGRGIDPEALRRHAVAGGFLDASEARALEGRELLDLIFLPGFSTSRVVTSKAGRGVGLDVVRNNLARLGGEIEIDTELGRGTTFYLKLPLTLLVSEALLVRLGEQRYALPVTAVAGMLSVPWGSLARADDGSETVEVEGEPIPVVRLARLLGVPSDHDETAGAPGALTPVVVVRAVGRSLALAVDELIEIEEVVIKGLGEFLAELSLVAGATVSAEGEVILVLNPMTVVQTGQMPAITSHALQRGWVYGGADREAEETTSRKDWASVLLVDDSISARKILGGQLARAGLAVTTAIDGQEAIEKLREASFDALVTDLEMPRINGYELIEEVRRRPDTRDLPVVVITTRAGSKHQDLARQLGIHAYFTKPVDEGLLVKRIRAAVSETSSAALTARRIPPSFPRIPAGESARKDEA